MCLVAPREFLYVSSCVGAVCKFLVVVTHYEKETCHPLLRFICVTDKDPITHTPTDNVTHIMVA